MDLSMWLTLIVLALALSMDALAVSVTNGLCYQNISPMKNALSSGLAFGVFQGLMPLIGYFVGNTFAGFVQSIDHWIALILLGFIGGRMVWGAIKAMRQPEQTECAIFSSKTLLVQAVATSIDALAVGVSLAVFGANIYVAVILIATITFCCSFCGVWVGRRFGSMLGEKATLFGGILLILIGVRIFWDHLDHIIF